MPGWRRVDVYDESISRKVIETNLEIYAEERKKIYKSLKEYAEAAIQSRNHVAFADEFINTFMQRRKYSLSYNDLLDLADCKVEEFIDECNKRTDNPDRISQEELDMVEAWKKTAEMHRNLQAPYYVKESVWRSPNYRYHLNEFTKNDRRKESYSKSGRKDWEQGKTPVKRDVLVQHAFVMGLNADETDQILMEAGYRSLYPLDAVDACAIIYLNEYAGRLDLSPYEVLLSVKDEINRVLRSLESEEYLYVEKGTQDKAQQGILTYAAGRHIDDDIKQLRNLLDGKTNETENAAAAQNYGLTRFLTEYYTEKIKNARGAEGYFNDPNVAANHIFTQRCYGFLKKTKDYLYGWQRYRKNLKGCSWNLTTTYKFHDFAGDSRNTMAIESFDEDVRAVLEKLNKSDYDSDEYYENCLRLIQYVRTFDFLNQVSPLTIVDLERKDQFTYARVLFEGEQRKYKNSADRKSGKRTKNRIGYAFQMAKKKDAVRFALSAGREEDIGEYLMLARYWKKNWYREISGGRSESDCMKEHFYPDPIDKLLIYALLYRDSLIERWCSGMDDPVKAQVKIRDMFPMRELILEISYDITFVYMFGRKHVHDFSCEDFYRLKPIYKEFESLRLDMIFPVRWKGPDGQRFTYDRDEEGYLTKKRQVKSKRSDKTREDDAR